MAPLLMGIGVALSLVVLVGCDRGKPATVPDCQLFHPERAKRTFDGRVGAVLLRNAAGREVELKAYHPDGTGDVELRRRVAPGSVLVLEGDEGVRLALGNDWGIQVEQSCVQPLGESAEWVSGEFFLRWDGDSLRAGL
jgi:hypothetical protein